MNIQEYIINKNSNTRRWSSLTIISFIGCLAAVGYLAITIATMCDYGNLKPKQIGVYANFITYIWFSIFHYFTNQSNILVYVFLVWYYIKPTARAFRKPTFMLFTTAYITITAAIYNFILLPVALSTQGANAGFGGDDATTLEQARTWVFNVYLHIFLPALMICFYAFYTKNMIEGKHLKKITNLYTLPIIKHLGFGIIYPIVYLIYAIILPITPAKTSVYGSLTNIYGNITDKFGDVIPGTPLNILVILASVVLFFISLTLYRLPYRKL